MFNFILTAREHYNVADADAYRAWHLEHVATSRRRGSRISVHDVPGEAVARVDGGTWLIDCDCYASVATGPEFGIACCVACGGVHEHIVFPDPKTIPDAEEILVSERNWLKRFWRGETVAELAAASVRAGRRVPDRVIESLKKESR